MADRQLTAMRKVQGHRDRSGQDASVRLFLSCLTASLLIVGYSGWAIAADLNPEVTISGVADKGLRQELLDISSLTNPERTYTSLSSLRRTAKRDAENIQTALISLGYYAAEVTPRTSRTSDNAKVSFEVSLSEKFTINQHIIQYTDDSMGERPADFLSAGLNTTPSANGKDLQKLETGLLGWFWNNGYPIAKAEKRYVQADFKTKKATALFEISSGPKTFFGETVVSGITRTDSEFITAYIPWEPGAIYEKADVVAYQEALRKTGLFTEISIAPTAPAPDGRTDILVKVSERKPNTVGIGASFSTDVGAGGQLFWEDRNLLGRGEALTAELIGSIFKQKLEFGFKKPLPEAPGNFSTALTLENELTDAFDAQSLELATSLSRFAYDKKLNLSAGLGVTYSQLKDAGVRSNFVYVTVPLTATWNNENDLLDATKGFRTSLTVTPYIGDLNFVRAILSGATRHTFGQEERFTLAARAALGTTFGIDRDDIPSTERFFAGGGGSVRGYAFQEAGPLDNNNDPLGGSSLLEINFEARAIVHDRLQIAAFLDGGNITASEIPDFSEDTLFGVGVGIRYATPVGPLRIDIATPLNSRATDDSVQLYVAIGQPF